MRISDWSSDVCSSDLPSRRGQRREPGHGMTSHLLINEISVLAFAALLTAAAVEDVRRLIIPNRIPLGIIILYPAYVLSTGAPVDWVGGDRTSVGSGMGV